MTWMEGGVGVSGHMGKCNVVGDIDGNIIEP